MAGRLDTDSLLLLHDALARLEQGFVQLPPIDTTPDDPAALREVLNEVAERLRDNYPVLPPALRRPDAEAAAPGRAHSPTRSRMWINPNNHALDGGRASSAMEKEAVAEIARMFGWDDAPRPPHAAAARWRTSRRCGSPASFSPAHASLASSQAHYTHGADQRRAGAPVREHPVRSPRPHGRRARSSERLAARRRRHRRRDARHDGDGLGGSAAGDPGAARAPRLPPARRRRLRRLLRARRQPRAARARRVRPRRRGRLDRHRPAQARPAALRLRLRALPRPGVGRLYKHDSPYTYFSSASSTWARSASSARGRARPPSRSGRRSASCRSSAAASSRAGSRLPGRGARAAREHSPRTRGSSPALRARARHRRLGRARGDGAADSSARARRIFAEAARRDLHLALAELPGAFFGLEAERVTCLRSVLMKPEHRGALPAIGRLLSGSTG